MREHMSCNELITSSIFIGMFSSNFVFSVEPLSTHALSTETLVKLRTMGEHSTTDPEGVPLVFLPLPVSETPPAHCREEAASSSTGLRLLPLPVSGDIVNT